MLDMRKIPSVSDYFVIVSGTSTTQVRAISDNIIEKLGDKGERVWHVEGEREALWILLDCGDVVAHVFLKDMRKFYELEKLWGRVPKKKFKEARARKRPAVLRKPRDKKPVKKKKRKR